MKESIVEIRGHRYRYAYDSHSGKTVYMGPIGEGPPLTEDEFLDEFFKIPELAEANFKKAGRWVDNVNDELSDAQVILKRDDGQAEIRLKEDDEALSTRLHTGGSLSTVNYAEAMAVGVEIYLDHGKERPIRIGPKTTVKITDDGRDQPGGKGKGRVTKLASKIRYQLVKKGEIDMNMLTDLVDNKDMDKVEEMVELLIQKGELKVIN